MTDDRRKSARDLSPERLRALISDLERQLPENMPVARNDESGERFDRRMGAPARARMTADRDFYEFPPHLREWFDGLDREDTARIGRLMQLNPKTVEWIADKNERELKSLDDAVEFVSSTRTAAKVIMWVSGVAVTIVGTAFAWAKLGFELFSSVKGGGR